MADDGPSSRYPFTFLACTYNLWGGERWKDRHVPLRRFLEMNRPDVLCVQESTLDARELITRTLPWLKCVDDPFPGWTEEGNIYWNADVFELVEYGAVDIGIIEEERRMFWVRLRCPTGDTLVVATAHFTWLREAGPSGEWVTVRVNQAKAAVVALDEVGESGEAVLFMGDFNDYLYPIDVLRNGGFEDSFHALGRSPVITHPAFPTSESPTLLDWMMHRGPIRPTLTSVVDFYLDGTPPSDHKPILTTYSLT
jgi:endonuclease/exonuclease/phosphatase family metal-dependent hydrolase